MAKGTEASYYEIAKTWVSEAFEVVTSADKFYEELRYTSSYVPRRIAREVWREHGQQTAWSSFVERRDDEKPLLRRFFHDIPSTAARAYNIKMRLSGLDPETGEEIETFMTVGFDHAPAKAEVVAQALSDAYYLPVGVDPATVNVSMDYMYHREGAQW